MRQKSKAELQSIPSAATLLFDKSVLPTGGKELSADGILALAQMGEKVSLGDPAVAYQKVIDRQRGELEELLKCFDGILTPGQMGQYQAALAETRELLKTLPKSPPPQPESTAQPAPNPLIEQQPVEIPDSGEEPADVTEEEANRAAEDP